MKYLTRHTALVLSYPRAFLRDDLKPVDLEGWYANDYTYQADPFFGLLDHAKDPLETLEGARGDCVDVATLAASVILSTSDSPVSLYVCVRWANPPGHLIAYDGERTYSSTGGITAETPQSYAERTGRRLMIRRRVRGSVGPRLVRNF